jgi:hypothetical protein
MSAIRRALAAASRKRTPSAPNELAGRVAHDAKQPRIVRGIVIGLLISGVLWSGLVGIAWLVWHYLLNGG